MPMVSTAGVDISGLFCLFLFFNIEGRQDGGGGVGWGGGWGTEMPVSTRFIMREC